MTSNIFNIILSLLLPLNAGEVVMVGKGPIIERHVIRYVGILYDTLIDAVDEINSVFSKVVRKKIIKIIFSILLSSNLK